MSLLRVLIVDDEPIARRVLRQELEGLNGIEGVGEAESGPAALVEIAALRPHLVFLDIQMPLLSGFELLNQLDGGHLPVIVMVTAFDQHAIRAFEAGAIDYLLKPVGPERLRQALDRASQICGHPKQIAENIAHLQQLAPVSQKKIVGRAGHEYFLLNPDEVLAFHASGDTVTIVTEKQRYRATQTLRALEERLTRSSFRRIHRNALVNINQIRKISMITSQRWLVTLNNGHEFIVSKRQARQVRNALHW